MEFSSQTFSTEASVEPPLDVGFFTWDIELDLMCGDTAVASLFGFDARLCEIGLPLGEYLQRVHEADRASLARNVSDSLITNRPQQASYRLKSGGGVCISVTSFGRPFRDDDGNPRRFAGILIPTPEENDPTDALRELCQLARKIAALSDRASVTFKLDEALALLEY